MRIPQRLIRFHIDLFFHTDRPIQEGVRYIGIHAANSVLRFIHFPLISKVLGLRLGQR